ncbi:MAG: PLP-dependent aminotransferase family protein [Alphaproteobacteria bacterium]|nr:MAG: PLP-dependent aminotransferase family protein [Alphaproteobacteria bacterium]
MQPRSASTNVIPLTVLPSGTAITVPVGGVPVTIDLARRTSAAAPGSSLADQIVEAIGGAIRAGDVVSGAKLPSIRALASRLGVSAFTVTESYDRLAALALVEARPGSGVYVTAPAARAVEALDTVAVPEGAFGPIDLVHAFVAKSEAWIAPGNAALPRSWIEQVWRGPAISRFQRSVFSQVTADSAPRGYPPLLQQIAAKLAREGIAVDPERHLLITHGSTHGMDLVLRTMLAPGDTVLVEDPCYFMTEPMLAPLGVQVVAIPRRQDGPDLAAVEQALTTWRPRLFLLQAVFHNPTGWSITPPVLHQLLGLAARFGVTVVDEDVFGDFHPHRPLRPAGLAGFEHVIHIGSFTKLLGSGLRVGFVAASPARSAELLTQRIRSVLTGSILEETLVHEVLASGQYRRQVERLWPRLASARAVAERRLMELGFRLTAATDPSPLIWAEAPAGINVEALVRTAGERGVLLAPGALFRPGRQPSRHLRFNATRATEPKLFETLAACLAASSPNPGVPSDCAGLV